MNIAPEYLRNTSCPIPGCSCQNPTWMTDDDDTCNCQDCQANRISYTAQPVATFTSHAGQPLWTLPQLATTQMELFVSARELIARTLTEPGWESLDSSSTGWDTDDLWTHKLRESVACGFVDDIGVEGVQRPIVLRVGHPFGYGDNTVYTGDGHHRIVAAAVHDQFVPVVYSRETFATVDGDLPYGSLAVEPDDVGYDPDADRCHYVPGADDVTEDIHDYV